MFEYAVILLFPVSAGVEKKKIKGKLNKLLYSVLDMNMLNKLSFKDLKMFLISLRCIPRFL